MKLFETFLKHLGSPKDQNSENVALAVVYCMNLSFAMIVIAILILAL